VKVRVIMRTRDIALLALASSGSPAPRTEYVTRNVIEQRAPTDESVRILQEMETAAWKKVTDAMAQEAENFFSIVTFRMEKNLESGKRHVHAVYSLNKRVFEQNIIVEEHEASKKFWDAVAKEVAEQLTGAMYEAFITKRHKPTT